ncbi:hypothetical protein P8C59_009127 [Phyllachora maydis]|uniref:FAS1 domain-containing protein n=1 Tax=Phyllachora maydis TaxID=1825666 RepID=A0AAD9IBV1_9PEZI|nr:hypothetical protein P8C59_009127 [Phyllachora maydis]
MLPAPATYLTLALMAWSPTQAQDTTPPPPPQPQPDLGSLLGVYANLSTFHGLLQQHPDILLQLPSYAGVTVVAPSNDAFAKLGTAWDPKNASLVTAMLQYHLLQGTVAAASLSAGPSTFAPTLLAAAASTNVTGGQNVILNVQPGPVVVLTSGAGSRSTVVQPDVPFAGGLVQVVDALLVPPPRLELVARDAYTDLMAFLAALFAAGLVDEFAAARDVTIFAPRSAAFQAVAPALTALAPDDLRAVLRYHLVPGAVRPSARLTNGTLYATALDTSATSTSNSSAPPKLRLTRAGNSMWVDTAQVIQPDILLANGVVHMVDAVLNPHNAAAAAARPNPALAAQPPAFAPAAGPTGTAAPTPFTAFLPCTTSHCPVTTAAGNATGRASTTAAGVRTSSSRGGAAPPRPRCTGAVGVLGLGWGLVVGAL